MKKNFLIASLCLFVTLFMGSCSEDEKDDRSNEFSEAPVEENKKLVEDAGLKVFSDMEAIANEDAIAVSQNFVALTETLQVGSAPEGSIGFSVLESLAQLNQSKDVIQLASSLKEGETEGGMEVLFQYKGVYTYNVENGWTYEAGGNVVKFIFPATSSDDDTMASLEVSKFETKMMGMELVPVAVTMTMKEGENTVMSLEYSANISSDMMTQEVRVSFQLGNYKLIVEEGVKEGKVFNSDLVVKSGNNEMLSYSLEAEGNLQQVEGSENPVKALDRASFSFQFGKILIDGDANVKAIREGETMLDESFDWENGGIEAEKTYADGLAKLMNENMTLALRFSADREMIAKGEFYKREYNYYGESYYDIDMRLVFGDESNVSTEAYFGSMLETFYQEMLGLQTKLQ